MPAGIPGFDEITRGGLPRGRTTLVVGGPGAGKTNFALQTLIVGAEQFGEPAIFVAFEENSRQIVANAKAFGSDLPRLEREHLFFLDAQLSPAAVRAGDFDLTGILAGLSAKAKEMNARRIVFDGLDVLLGILNDPVAERREIYRLHEWLLKSGMTGLITAKAGEADRPSADRYSFMQFMVDCVVVLHYRMIDRVSLRGVRVLKYRGSGFSEGEFPLVITAGGLDVATFGDIQLVTDVSNERVSSGVAELDAMLSGGYHRGSCVLISGAPGTAKTTLAGACLEAGCRSGERALFVSFDESSGQLIRNLQSVNIDLQPQVDNGRLRIHAMRTEARSAEEHLIQLKLLIAEHKPTFLALDPLSALEKTGGQLAAKHASVRLIDLAKAANITTVCTSLVDNTAEQSEAHISTIADTWIHLEYLAMGGERNRTLTIIKARGTKHSNQVRELILTDDGPYLADVYTAGGQVLVGTARWEREQQQALEQTELERDAARRQRELELVELEIGARIAALERELETKRADLSSLRENEQQRLGEFADSRAALKRIRLGSGQRSLVKRGKAEAVKRDGKNGNPSRKR
jgi:circadian clock protein KaiC